ncbi:MAG: serine/threonine protein kinase [Myxococcales bacterium]|nr:serine/threonine protein kinase [Myxococcales bacterium]
MGVVYAAYDPELDRKVAVKLVRASVVSSRRASRARERLLREAQAMARLAHPNVVTVHDVGEHDGQVFIAMEFVRGMTLLEWCRDFPRRPWSETLETYMQAGRGLAAAHRQGIIHRDFKPDSQKPTCHTGQQPLALHSAFVWA